MTKILIHVGPPKTGSTSIQNFLRDNSAELETLGIFYAPRSDDGYFPAQPADIAGHMRANNWEIVERFAARVIDMAAKRSADFTILSAENFGIILDDTIWQRFLSCFDGLDCQIVFVRRDHRTLIKSSFYTQLEGNAGHLHIYETIDEFVVASKKWVAKRESYFNERGALMLNFDELAVSGNFCNSFVHGVTGRAVELKEMKMNVTKPVFPSRAYFWTYPVRKMIAMRDGAPVNARTTRDEADQIMLSIDHDSGQLKALWQGLDDRLNQALDKYV